MIWCPRQLLNHVGRDLVDICSAQVLLDLSCKKYAQGRRDPQVHAERYMGLALLLSTLRRGSCTFGTGGNYQRRQYLRAGRTIPCRWGSLMQNDKAFRIRGLSDSSLASADIAAQNND